MDSKVTDTQFAADVLRGLSASPKFLMSRYFYDARGDRIFQDIMASEEYYLTDCELEILREQSADIVRALPEGEPLELLELGSGDGAKIVHLLDALHGADRRFVYRPVDLSINSLDLLEAAVRPGRPWLDIEPVHANYFRMLEHLDPAPGPRVMAFMGSNLGNFGGQAAVDFLGRLRAAMAPGDALLIGLDLKKDATIIRRAYDDSAGHTRAFNLNLLRRINHELGGEFRLDRFSHRPEYDPDSGAARSFLVSDVRQEVRIAALGEVIRFEAGERIFMEVSQKYDDAMIASMAAAAGFEPAHRFVDGRGWYTNQVWRPVAGATDHP